MECTVLQILTPLAALGRKAKTATKIAAELAKKTDLHPIAMINSASAGGGLITLTTGLKLLIDPKASFGTYFVTAAGLVVTLAGHLGMPHFKVNKEENPDQKPQPDPPDSSKPPKRRKTPPVVNAPPSPSPEDAIFKECIDNVTGLKTVIVCNTLSKTEERNKVTELLNILRDTTGKTTTQLNPEKHLKIRKYTLDILRDIIVNQENKNDQTIGRSLRAIFNLFMKDTKDNLKVDAGATLLALVNEREDTLNRLTINAETSITEDSIITRLEQIKK